MKLQFESNLDYQRDAINAVIDLFEGFPQLSKQNGFDIFNNAEQLTLDIPEANPKTLKHLKLPSLFIKSR